MNSSSELGGRKRSCSLVPAATAPVGHPLLRGVASLQFVGGSPLNVSYDDDGDVDVLFTNTDGAPAIAAVERGARVARGRLLFIGNVDWPWTHYPYCPDSSCFAARDNAQFAANLVAWSRRS